MAGDKDSLIIQQRKNTKNTNDNKNDNEYAKQIICNTIFSPLDDQSTFNP